MTRSLRSTPITGGSPLLMSRSDSRIPNGTHTHAKRGLLPISHSKTQMTGIGSGLLLFHAKAADRARVAFMPDTAWPINGPPPDSSRDRQDTPVSGSPKAFSTRQQRFACARLPDPHLTHDLHLCHIGHHDHVTAFAACGGLKRLSVSDTCWRVSAACVGDRLCRGAFHGCGRLVSVPHGRCACRNDRVALAGDRRGGCGAADAFVPALCGSGSGFAPGFAYWLVFDGGDAFGFAFGPGDFRFGQQDPFGDVLSGDLVPISGGDGAPIAVGAVVAARAGQLGIAARAAG